MNVGRCYTAPAEFLANCSIPALGWKWSADFEIIESGEGTTLLWSGELREILQQAQGPGTGLPNLRITLLLSAALLRRDVFQQAVPDERGSGLDSMVELARELKKHPLITRLEAASPLPYQVGGFIQRVFQHLDVDGFFGGDARHVLALLEGQVNFRQLRKRLSSTPLSDPPLGTSFKDLQRLLNRLNELDPAEILDLWKTGHSHLETYDAVLTTLGRPTTLGRMIEALAFPQTMAAAEGSVGTPARTPDEALREISRLEGGETVLRAARGTYPALHFPSLKSRAVESQQGGYSDITRHGSIERLLISQLAYDADEFLRRFAENELLYYQCQTQPEIPLLPLTCLIDMGVSMWGRPRLLAAGCAMAAWKSAWVKKRPFDLFQTFFGDAIRLQPDQSRQLSEILTGIDDSESPAAAVQALWQSQHKLRPQTDLLLITSPAAWQSEALARVLAPIREHWRVFGVTLDRADEMRFWQLAGASSRLINRVDFRCLVPDPAQTGAPPSRLPLAAEANRMLPDLFRIGHREPVKALAFTPDSSLLFSGDVAGRICWWGPLRKSLDQESTLPRPGLTVRGLTAGSTVLAVLAVESAPAQGTVARWYLFRYDLITGGLIDEFALPTEDTPTTTHSPGVRWPKISPDQHQVSVTLPTQVLVIRYGPQGQNNTPPTVQKIPIPGTPITCVQGRQWATQYLLTEQRNLYRIDLDTPGGSCRHLRPEPGAQIAVDRDGGILALRGRDLVLYPANPNKDSGPSDESMVASLREANWSKMLGAWDGSVLLSSAGQTLFLPVEARHKPVAIPHSTGRPWVISPWSRLVATAAQREVHVFHARKGEPIFVTPAPRLQSSVMNMFFGPDGHDLWVNYGAASGHHWQWKTSLTFQQTSGQPPPPRSVNYSLVNSAVHRIEFYAGKILIAMERHRISITGADLSWNSCDELVSCAVHPDDSTLAVLDSRNVIWLMRAEDLRLIAALYGSEERFAAWNAAGQLLGDIAVLGSSAVGADYAGFGAFVRAQAHQGGSSHNGPGGLHPAASGGDGRRSGLRPVPTYLVPPGNGGGNAGGTGGGGSSLSGGPNSSGLRPL